MNPAAMTRERAEAFCEANWLPLAGAAWRQHAENGRGALLLTWTVVERWETGDHPFGLSITYATEPRQNADLAALVAVYDPETSFVAAFTSDPSAGTAPADPKSTWEGRIAAGAFLAAWIFTATASAQTAHRRTAH